MAITFELKTNEGIFQFDTLDKDGNLLLTSAEFASRSEADQAIQDVRIGSMMSQQIAVGESNEGEKFFVIKSMAGQPLVKSVPFASEMTFNNALHSFREGACIAKITDLT